MSMVEVKVPDIGDFKEVEVIELLVKVGDTVKVDQSLITVESDKASMEIPSSHAGVVKEIKIKLGDKVAEGSVLVTVEAAEQGAPVLHPHLLPLLQPKAAAKASACCHGRRSISPSSAPQLYCRCRASRKSAVRICIATGS